MNRTEHRVLIATGFIFCVELYLLIFYGNHHVDEGYYHIIAHLTAHGSLPYRDYFYVQSPIYPLVYGLIFKFMGSNFIVARGLSSVFALATFLLTVRISRNLMGSRAAVASACLFIGQLFTIYYLTIIKLYAISAFILVLMVWILNTPWQSRIRYPLSAMVLAIGVGTRLTILPGIIIIFVLSAYRTRNIGIIIITILAGVITLAVIFTPFYWIAPDTFLYQFWGYHFEKESFSMFRQVLHRFDALVQLFTLYHGTWMLVIGVFLGRFWIPSQYRLRLRWPDGAKDSAWILLIITLFHFTSQVSYVHRYLTMMFPAILALLGPELIRLEKTFSGDWRYKNWISYLFVFFCILGLFGSHDEDILSFPKCAYLQLKSVAEQVQLLTPENSTILTFNNSVAVETNRAVLAGDEMNVLTYDPSWTNDRCRQFRILNVEMLKSSIQQKKFAAILATRFSFIGNFPTFYNPGEIGARPAIMDAIQEHYWKVAVIPGFGYLGEDAELFLPKSIHDVVTGSPYPD